MHIFAKLLCCACLTLPVLGLYCKVGYGQRVKQNSREINFWVKTMVRRIDLNLNKDILSSLFPFFIGSFTKLWGFGNEAFFYLMYMLHLKLTTFPFARKIVDAQLPRRVLLL